MVTALGNPPLSDYAEIARRPLEAEQCALVVIDIQEKLLSPIFQKEQLVRNAQLLIRAAGILKIPALVSTQYAKGLGATLPEVSSLLAGTEAIDKTLFSCFGTDFETSARASLLFLFLYANDRDFGEPFGERRGLEFCGHAPHHVFRYYTIAALMALQANFERDIEENSVHFVVVVLREFDPMLAFLRSQIRGVHIIHW